MALLPTKEGEIFGYETHYREIGYYISRLEQYQKALKWFDEALERTPDDKRALVGRSRARAKACLYEGALVDSQKAMDINPHDLPVVGNHALTTFLSCEFEKALVINKRMTKLRRKPDYFVLGAMDCMQAIDGAIGESSGHPLRDHFLIIRRLAWQWNFEAQKPFQPKARFKRKIVRPNKHEEPVVEGYNVKKKLQRCLDQSLMCKPPPGLEDMYEDTLKQGAVRDRLLSRRTNHVKIPFLDEPYQYRPLQNYTTNIENYMAEKYLDSMYLDKLFLRRVRSDTRIINPNKKGEAELFRLSRVGYRSVAYRQELLRTRRPFYYIKYHEMRGAKKHTLQNADLLIERELIKNKADHLLTQLRDAVYDKQLPMALRCAERLYDHCTMNHIRYIPDRQYYLEQINDNICEAYFDLHRLDEEMTDQDQERHILVLFGQSVDREPSHDSLLEELKEVHIDYKKMVQKYKMRLLNTLDPKEVALLTYELAKCHLALRHYELSRVYARKCVTEARKSNNIKWLINGLMMLTKISVQYHNKNDAKMQLVAALEVAEKNAMPELERFIQKCIRVVKHLQFYDILPSRVIQKRERAITKLMPEMKLRDEVTHLFHLIDMMPPQRRLMVIPGIRIGKLQPSHLIKPKVDKRRPTINPVRANMTDRPSLDVSMMERKNWRKGIGFLDLIQNHLV